MQTFRDLLFLDIYGLVPRSSVPLGVLDGGGQTESPRHLQKPSALFPWQLSSSGETGGGEVVLIVTYLRQVAILKCTFQF